MCHAVYALVCMDFVNTDTSGFTAQNRPTPKVLHCIMNAHTVGERACMTKSVAGVTIGISKNLNATAPTMPVAANVTQIAQMSRLH